MPIPDIIFLTAVCLGFGVFMIVLASAAWYCRESLVAHEPIPHRAPMRVRRPHF